MTISDMQRDLKAEDIIVQADHDQNASHQNPGTVRLIGDLVASTWHWNEAQGLVRYDFRHAVEAGDVLWFGTALAGIARRAPGRYCVTNPGAAIKYAVARMRTLTSKCHLVMVPGLYVPARGGEYIDSVFGMQHTIADSALGEQWRPVNGVCRRAYKGSTQYDIIYMNLICEKIVHEIAHWTTRHLTPPEWGVVLDAYGRREPVRLGQGARDSYYCGKAEEWFAEGLYIYDCMKRYGLPTSKNALTQLFDFILAGGVAERQRGIRTSGEGGPA